jgi:hypothetical protein
MNDETPAQPQVAQEPPEQPKADAYLTAPVPSEGLQTALPEDIARRYFGALVWALGAGGEFKQREPGDGAYWWRRELCRRAGLEWDGKQFIDNPSFAKQEDAAIAPLPIDLAKLLGPRPMSIVPSTTDKAYAAGFFDGEGFVTIAFMSNKIMTKGTVYTMRVGVGQNEHGPLLWLRERWGGSVRVLKRKTEGGNLPYKWDCCARMAAAFLRDVRPFLQVKAARADIALNFQDSVFTPGKHGHTAEYRERLEGFRVALTGRNTHKPVPTEARA